jgi:hypothetical protein
MERTIEQGHEQPKQEPVLPFDVSFKISATHRFIFKFAKERGGIFDRRDYAAHLSSGELEPKMQKQMLRWNDTTMSKLWRAGYVRRIGQNRYQLVDVAMDWLGRPKPQENFALKPNHLKLLAKHQEGLLKTADLKAAYAEKPEKERQRQSKMIDGMLRSLNANGYLERTGKGEYTLTEQAYNGMMSATSASALVTEKPKVRERQVSAQGLKITAFDRKLLDVCVLTEAGFIISSSALDAHERGPSLKKRIATLERAKLIRNGTFSPELVHSIESAVHLQRGKALTPELLSPGQRQVLDDIGVFASLTPQQIMKYIYKGDGRRYSLDMDLLLRQGILVENTTYHVFTVGEKGRSLFRLMNPERSIAKSKLYSRAEEVGHDTLIYSAYKDVEKELRNTGCTITAIKTDRMMRSEDAKKYGHMLGDYPDLRVEYTDKTGLKMVRDIEVDCGYDTRTIGEKLAAFFTDRSVGSFSWCCSTIKQAAKVAKLAGDKSKGLNRHKPLYISYVDDAGRVKRMKWG